MIDLDALLKEHTPSIVDEIESELAERAIRVAFASDDKWDTADLALRICHCGERIDGFYDYVAHLKEVANVA